MIVRKLLEHEIYNITTELENLVDLWEPHSPPTSLRYGKTIYLQKLNFYNFEIQPHNFDRCPRTYEFIKSIALNNPISYCYWHRLMPGDKILKHHDKFLPFVQNNLLAHRYHIYLKNNINFLLELDETLLHTPDLDYSVIDFPLRKTHSYENKGNEPWSFLVFDTFRLDK